MFILLSDILYAVFTGEGSTRRTMYAVAASAVLNIVLDPPILIYGAGMGVAGAAWATLISMAAVCALLLYWFLVRKDTYITLDWSASRPTDARQWTSSASGSPQALSSC